MCCDQPTPTAVKQAGSPRIRAEVLLALHRYFIACEGVVLAAAMSDLDRAEHRGNTSRLLPVDAVCDAIQQSRAEGVAATGRIDERFRFRARYLDLSSIGVDRRAFRTKRYHHRFDAPRECLERLPGFFLQQLRLVIINRQ